LFKGGTTLKLIIEGEELTTAILNGVDFPLPVGARITITAGRGSNPDRCEFEWGTDAATAEVADDEPPFEVEVAVQEEEVVSGPETAKEDEVLFT
jgi:hypothetical protein